VCYSTDHVFCKVRVLLIHAAINWLIVSVIIGLGALVGLTNAETVLHVDFDDPATGLGTAAPLHDGELTYFVRHNS